MTDCGPGGEGETKDGTEDSALGIRMNGGPVYCNSRQDKVRNCS